jgi:hypothetical protein
MPVVTDHCDEAQDPDPHQSDRLDPDTHQRDADTQHCLLVLFLW